MDPEVFVAPDGLPDQNLRMTEIGCTRERERVVIQPWLRLASYPLASTFPQILSQLRKINFQRPEDANRSLSHC